MLRNLFLILIAATFLTSCTLAKHGSLVDRIGKSVNESLGTKMLTNDEDCNWGSWREGEKVRYEQTIEVFALNIADIITSYWGYGDDRIFHGKTKVVMKSKKHITPIRYRECKDSSGREQYYNEEFTGSETTIPDDTNSYSKILQLTEMPDKRITLKKSGLNNGSTIYSTVVECKIPYVASHTAREVPGRGEIQLQTKIIGDGKVEYSGAWGTWIKMHSNEVIQAREKKKQQKRDLILAKQEELARLEREKQAAKEQKQEQEQEREKTIAQKQPPPQQRKDKCNGNADMCWLLIMDKMACGDLGTIQRMHSDVNRGWLSRTPKSGPGWKHWKRNQFSCYPSGKQHIYVQNPPLEWWVLDRAYRH